MWVGGGWEAEGMGRKKGKERIEEIPIMVLTCFIELHFSDVGEFAKFSFNL